MIIKIWFSQKEPLTFSLRKYKLYIFFKTQSRVFTPFSGRKRRIYAGNGVNTPLTGMFNYEFGGPSVMSFGSNFFLQNIGP